MSAFTCIRPNCPVDCCMCVKAIRPDDEPRQIINSLLNEFATDGHGAPFEDGEHPFVDRARKYLCRPAVDPSAPASGEGPTDTQLLDFLADESLDLICFAMPIPLSEDADIGWRTVQHHQGKPTERIASEVYRDDPRQAIREAMRRLERDPYCVGPLHEDDAPTSPTEPASPDAALCPGMLGGAALRITPLPETRLDWGDDEPAGTLKRCAANRDGDCEHAQCPQLRDGEPSKSGRHCPLDDARSETQDPFDFLNGDDEPAAEGGAA